MMLQDKVVVVTGAARGIGREIALALGGEGAAVAVLDIQVDKAQAVATVAPPAAEEVTAPVAAAVEAVAAAPAEPEVLTERKPKEEPEAEEKDKKGKKKE